MIRTVLELGLFGTLGISFVYLLVGDFVGNLLNSPVLVALTGLMAGWIAIAVVQEITAETFRGFPLHPPGHLARWIGHER